MNEIPGYRGTSHLLEHAGELVIAASWNRRPLTYPMNHMPTAISHLTDFCFGRLKQRTLLWIFIPLIAGVIFRQFDVRDLDVSRPIRLAHQVNVETPLSQEQSAVSRDRLRWMAVAGLLTIPFAGYIGRRLRVISPVPAAIGALVLGAGAISLILGALIVLQPFLHEMFARGAGIFLGLGMLAFYLCALRGLSVSPSERHARLPIFLAWSLIVPPALLVIVLRLLIAAHFQWSDPRLSGDRKSIVVAPGILGMDRLDSGVSFPARRRRVSAGKWA